jgi:predicted metalloprotease with PDZ domain
MSQNAQIPLKQRSESQLTTCLNCHAPMPSELRFCRNCGFRLGEGSAEYTETVRFSNPNSMIEGFPRAPSIAASGVPARKRRKRISGMTWMFLGLLLFFVAAVTFTSLVAPIRHGIHVEVAGLTAPRSYVGVDGFDTADGGVTFDNVEPPGSPADKAGLVGGDIITGFDGKPVTEEDEMSALLRNTPVGKTVDVVFIRDGETKTTKLTTVGKEEFDRLAAEFRKRSEGKGRFGYDDDQSERVLIPGTKMAGVKLNEISASLPADMAGIKEGDIVIEFDGIPIRTVDELRSRIQRALPYTTVNVGVMRGAERLEIPVKMGRQN